MGIACSAVNLEAEELKNDIAMIKVVIKYYDNDAETPCWKWATWKEFTENDIDKLKLNIEDVTCLVGSVEERGYENYDGTDDCPDLIMKFRTQDIFGCFDPSMYEGKEVRFYVYAYSSCGDEIFNSFDEIRFAPVNFDELDSNEKQKK